MSEKKISKLEKMARDGAFREQFGGEWFCKIKPAYGTEGKGIDKVIFSFVKKGTAGKEFFDIYQDIDYFDCWCDDILADKFLDKLIEESKAGEKYPKYYRYITGKDGEKSVGFMLSRTGGPMVNASVKEQGKKAVYANVPLEYWWLKSLAKQFKRTVAPRFAELDKTLMAASTAYRHEMSESDEAYEGASDNEVSEAVPEKPVAEAVTPELKKPVEAAAPEPKKLEKFSGSVWWCVNKGTKIETRKDVAVITALVEKISDNEKEGLLESDPKWQYVELVFFPKNVERAKFEEKFNDICGEVNTKDAYKLPSLTYTVGDVRNGRRQLIFQSA